MSQFPSSKLGSELTLDGRKLTFRAMTAADKAGILAFARALPQADLAFLRRDITREAVVDEWVRDVADGFVTTLLVFDGTTVMGYAVVHRSDLDWSAHVAELRVLVASEMRGKGLGRRLTEEAFRIALGLGVEKMTAQMPVDQTGATVTFRNLGFKPEALLRDHVKDRDGTKRDLLVMSLDIAAYVSQLQALGVDEL